MNGELNSWEPRFQQGKIQELMMRRVFAIFAIVDVCFGFGDIGKIGGVITK